MAVAGRWDMDGAAKLSADLANAAAQVPALMAVAVEKSAGDLVGLAQQNASGRPGPNAPTGDLRGSISVEDVETSVTEVSRSAGTDRAQARRLEFGFVGADSLGRVFDSPPYPFMGPATDVVEPVFYAAMEAVANKATS